MPGLSLGVTEVLDVYDECSLNDAVAALTPGQSQH